MNAAVVPLNATRLIEIEAGSGHRHRVTDPSGRRREAADHGRGDRAQLRRIGGDAVRGRDGVGARIVGRADRARARAGAIDRERRRCRDVSKVVALDVESLHCVGLAPARGDRRLRRRHRDRRERAVQHTVLQAGDHAGDDNLCGGGDRGDHALPVVVAVDLAACRPVRCRVGAGAVPRDGTRGVGAGDELVALNDVPARTLHQRLEHAWQRVLIRCADAVAGQGGVVAVAAVDREHLDQIGARHWQGIGTDLVRAAEREAGVDDGALHGLRVGAAEVRVHGPGVGEALAVEGGQKRTGIGVLLAGRHRPVVRVPSRNRVPAILGLQLAQVGPAQRQVAVRVAALAGVSLERRGDRFGGRVAVGGEILGDLPDRYGVRHRRAVGSGHALDLRATEHDRHVAWPAGHGYCRLDHCHRACQSERP